MNMEKDIFKKSTILYNKLIPYGFTKIKDDYLYSQNILGDTFRIDIIISHNEITSHIYDLTFNAEYTNYRNENIQGEFVNSIREELTKLLQSIKKECTTTTYFYSNQANRLCQMIYDKYADLPEFPWEKSDDSGIFRNPKTKKWYGLVMRIDKSKIKQGKGAVEIINLKLDPDKITELVKLPGFYPAYHMNKTHWITITLDDTITDEELMQYVLMSHKFTE